MIYYIAGDIRNIEADVAVHCTNCWNGFGSGLAGNIAKEWPIVKEKYHEFVIENGIGNEELLGQIQPVRVADNIDWVVNLFGQYKYRGIDGGQTKNYTRDSAMKKGFEALREWMEHQHLETLLVPDEFGSGLAGGNKDDIHGFIEEAFLESNINVYYVIYKKD